MSDTSRHAVWLYDRHVGSLFHHDNYTWFEFDADYLVDPRRPVLGLRFEERLGRRIAANLRLPPWFSNLLPEGPLRTLISADSEVSTDREMELLAHVGHDLPGAVRVLPDGVHPVEDLESVIEAAAQTSPTHRPATQSWRMSPAGVGLKFSMLRVRNRFTCPATGLGGDWILKLPDHQYPHVPLSEFTMMRLAAAAGIDVPEVALVHRDEIEGLPDAVWPSREKHAFAIRRFDRDGERGLVHIEDLAQVRNVYPVDKYDGNFETIAAPRPDFIDELHDLATVRDIVDMSISQRSRTLLDRRDG